MLRYLADLVLNFFGYYAEIQLVNGERVWSVPTGEVALMGGKVVRFRQFVQRRKNPQVISPPIQDAIGVTTAGDAIDMTQIVREHAGWDGRFHGHQPPMRWFGLLIGAPLKVLEISLRDNPRESITYFPDDLVKGTDTDD